MKLQEEGCEESCERRHREGHKGDAREIKKVRSGNTGGENRVDLKGKMRYTRTLKKTPTDGGMPPKWLQTMEESILDRYSPQGDVVWWRINTKAVAKSKKKKESKRASYYALTSLYCLTLPLPFQKD